MDRNEIEEIVDGESAFILTDEEGAEYEFELLGYMDYDNSLYVVLAPAGSDPESDEDLELVVMKVEVVDDVPAFEAVDDEDTAQAVLDAFIESLAAEAGEE